MALYILTLLLNSTFLVEFSSLGISFIVKFLEIALKPKKH